MSNFEQTPNAAGSGSATEVTLAAILANQTNDQQTTQFRDSAGNEIGTATHPIVTAPVPVVDLGKVGVFDDTGGVAYTDILSQAQTSTQLLNGSEVSQTTVGTDTSHPNVQSFGGVWFEIQGALVGATAVIVRVYAKMYGATSSPAPIYHSNTTGGVVALQTQFSAADLVGKSRHLVTTNAQGSEQVWVTLEAVGVPTPGTSITVRAKKVS